MKNHVCAWSLYRHPTHSRIKIHRLGEQLTVHQNYCGWPNKCLRRLPEWLLINTAIQHCCIHDRNDHRWSNQSHTFKTLTKMSKNMHLSIEVYLKYSLYCLYSCTNYLAKRAAWLPNLCIKMHHKIQLPKSTSSGEKNTLRHIHQIYSPHTLRLRQIWDFTTN